VRPHGPGDVTAGGDVDGKNPESGDENDDDEDD
jgi:hypothetical protein